MFSAFTRWLRAAFIPTPVGHPRYDAFSESFTTEIPLRLSATHTDDN